MTKVLGCQLCNQEKAAAVVATIALGVACLDRVAAIAKRAGVPWERPTEADVPANSRRAYREKPPQPVKAPTTSPRRPTRTPATGRTAPCPRCDTPVPYRGTGRHPLCPACKPASSRPLQESRRARVDVKRGRVAA